MSKHHIENLAEQIANKGHASSPFHKEKKPNQESELIDSEDKQWKVAMDDSSIQHTAYQIHQEKGGTALDNWLEAEHILKNNGKAVSRLINEGNPNT